VPKRVGAFPFIFSLHCPRPSQQHLILKAEPNQWKRTADFRLFHALNAPSYGNPALRRLAKVFVREIARKKSLK
jgi:hypothetical protein